jgi:hypothetical protein
VVEFFQTVMGNRFFEGHVPSIVKSLQAIAVELKRANDLKERELQLQETEPQD